MRGQYPNALTVDDAGMKTLMAEMLDGSNAGLPARVRTEHGDERHTFSLSLQGFAEAAGWVLGKCGYRIKDRSEESKGE